MEQEDLDKISHLNVNIMFCAAPKQLISFKNKKSEKYKKFFYSLFCFYLAESEQYVVFCKTFKGFKKKTNQNIFFKLDKTNNYIYKTKEEVTGYLSKFLLSISEHERFLNEEALHEEKINAVEAIDILNDWESNLFQYFNEILENSAKYKWET